MGCWGSASWHMISVRFCWCQITVRGQALTQTCCLRRSNLLPAEAEVQCLSNPYPVSYRPMGPQFGHSDPPYLCTPSMSSLPPSHWPSLNHIGPLSAWPAPLTLIVKHYEDLNTQTSEILNDLLHQTLTFRWIKRVICCCGMVKTQYPNVSIESSQDAVYSLTTNPVIVADEPAFWYISLKKKTFCPFWSSCDLCINHHNREVDNKHVSLLLGMPQNLFFFL